MDTNSKEVIVMSVGGSVIVPDTIDVEFLKRLKQLIETEVNDNGRKFILIAGGGKTSRNYQEAASGITELTHEDLDWIGIHATRLNGHLLRIIFQDIAHPVVITNPDEILDTPMDESEVVVAAGYRPGASTDLRSVQIAQLVESTKVVNVSNIDYVFTADPKKDIGAKKIEDITWTEFRKLLPEGWDPGQSSPFDPIAAKRAEELGIEVAVINGDKLTEVQKYFSGESFTGTRIHS